MLSVFHVLMAFALCVLLSIIFLKKIFPGLTVKSLKKMQMNADVIRSMPYFSASLDCKGIITEVHSIPCSFPYADTSGFSGRNWCEFIGEPFHQVFMDAVEKAMNSGEPRSFQFSLETESGKKWYQSELVKTSDTEILLVSRDVTAEKIQQEKLSFICRIEDMASFCLNVPSMTVAVDKAEGASGPVVPLEEALSVLNHSDALELKDSIERLVSGEQGVFSLKCRLDSENGSSSKWFLIRGCAVSPDADGTAGYITGAIQNITGSVSCEEKHSELNYMLKNIIDTFPVGLYWKNTNLKYEGANREFLVDYGIASEELLREEGLSDEKAGLIEQQVLETGRPVLNHQEKIRQSGSLEKTLSVSRLPLRSAAGDISGIMGTYTDITESSKFRDQLIQGKEFLSMLVENLPVGFFAKNPSSGMTYRIWNRKMEDIFGFSAAQAVDHRDWNLFGTGAAELLANDDDAVLRNPEWGKVPRIYKLYGRKGLRTVSVVRVLLYDHLLDTTLVAGVVDDITREDELEHQLRQAQKMEAIGRLAGGVAHDFNNLLQVIMGSAEIGASGSSTPEKSFRQILLAGEKAMILTRQLLSFSRENAFNRRSFTVDVRIGEFVRMVHRIIGENTTLEFHEGAFSAQVEGDPFQLEQVIMNLLVNARDAIPSERGGVITVETSTAPVVCTAGMEPVECVVISVSDNGEGIPDNIKDKIFEPFFTTKAMDRGTGLGLASSYAIVARHKGIIKVESTPGEVTRFSVCIPVSHRSPVSDTEVRKADSQDKALAPLTILLAEDEEMVRDIAKTILGSAGHTVIEALNGKEAVELFMENRDVVDLMVFDAIMPVMSGSEAFVKIHSMNPDVPVLFCTGYSGDVLIKSMPGAEKADVLQKPYAAGDLLKAVTNLMRKK